MAPGRKRRDARVRRLERAIEAALAPGQFIGWRSSSAFVSGLEEAAAAIEPLIQSAPAEATDRFDAFLAGCIEKAEEIDHSGGDLGRFAKGLVCGWVRARQAMGADPDETASAGHRERERPAPESFEGSFGQEQRSTAKRSSRRSFPTG
jgi:hypothetical protein